MRYKKRAKSQLDMRIIIDAVKMFYTMPHIDTYCFIAGDGDLVPLLSYLKAGGKRLITVSSDVIDGNDHMFDEKFKLSIQYTRPVKLSKKQLNEKLKALSERTTKIMSSKSKSSKAEREKLIQELEAILNEKPDDVEDDEQALYESLQSLLEILKI